MRQMTYEMKMPRNYVDMEAADMEYDGGFNWGKFIKYATIVCSTVAAIGLSMATGGSALGLAMFFGGTIGQGAVLLKGLSLIHNAPDAPVQPAAYRPEI